MRSLKLAVLCAAAVLLWTNTVIAKEAGDWIVRAGVTNISPKSDNGTIAGADPITLDVKLATMMTFDGTYMITNNFGVELLAALPFKHDIYADDGNTRAKVATTKHLPPTLSAVYHFNSAGKFQPYVGAGLNWTIFFDEKAKGPLEDAGNSVKLSDSVGIAGVVGLDIALTEKMFLNGNIRYMNIETDVKVDGTKVATAKIDPWVYAINIGWRF